MTPPLLLTPRQLAGLQRVLIIALLLPLLLLALVAGLPALLVLPFLPDGTGKA